MTIDAIVPVYNEEKNVAITINELLLSGLFKEIICVNDGSTDNSLEVLKSFAGRINLVSYNKNRGKGNALVEGIKRSLSEIVCFIDADIRGLKRVNLLKLINPVADGLFDISVGCVDDPVLKFWPKASATVAGERVYRKKDLLPFLNQMKSKRFGVDIFLNSVLKGKKTKVVPLYGVHQVFKFVKYNSLREIIKESLKEGYELGREVVLSKARRWRNG